MCSIPALYRENPPPPTRSSAGRLRETIRHSRWARAYYQQQKEKGKPHHTIARSLAFKWQRIIWRCWQQRSRYNDDTYMQALSRTNPELFQLALQTSLPGDAKN